MMAIIVTERMEMKFYMVVDVRCALAGFRFSAIYVRHGFLANIKLSTFSFVALNTVYM